MITVQVISAPFDYPVLYNVYQDGVLTHLQIVEFPSGSFPVDIIDRATEQDIDIGFKSVESALEAVAEYL